MSRISCVECQYHAFPLRTELRILAGASGVTDVAPGSLHCAGNNPPAPFAVAALYAQQLEVGMQANTDKENCAAPGSREQRCNL